MKKYIVLLAVLVLSNLLAKAQTFTITGKITGQTTGYLHLFYRDINGKGVNDSSKIVNGNFEFKGNISEPTRAWFYGAIKSMNVEDPNTTDIFIELAAMNVTVAAGDFKNTVLTGSATEYESVTLEKEKKPVYDAMKPLSDAFRDANKVYMKAVKNKADDKTATALKEKAAALHDQFDPYWAQIAAIDYKYFDAHPTSYLTACELEGYAGRLPLDSFKMYYARLGAKVQSSFFGTQLAEEIKKLDAGSPCSVAADFTSKGIDGKSISLSSFKNKYVILDFWASWCVPCRHSNPHMITLYHKYHDQGLEVIGVASDDQTPDAWRKAVVTDNVGIWYNVLAGLDISKARKGEPNDNYINDKYGIQSLPTKIIIDRDGKIVGRFDDSAGHKEEDMDKLLAIVFGK